MRMRLLLLGLSACTTTKGVSSAAEGDAMGECADGVDNDDNGDVDCADAGCAGAPDCEEATPADAPPSAPTVAVSPEAPAPGEALTCTVVSPGVDPEGQSVSHRFAWKVDGASALLEGSSVPADTTTPLQSWTCEAWAQDSVQESDPGAATVVVGRGNTPPEGLVVAIEPAAPADNQPLTCVIVEPALDADGDTLSVTYAWTVNGADAGHTDAAVSASQTVAGDTWVCSAIPSDGIEAGAVATATASVGEARYSGDVTGLGGTVYSASNCFLGCSSSTYWADNAFDDNTDYHATWHTMWYGGPEWVAVDFGAGNDKTITRYGLMGAGFHEGYRARDWELQGSAEGSIWTTVHAVTDADLTYVMYGGEPFTYYAFENSLAFRHWRIYVTANMGGQPYSNEVGIVEIEMMEDEGVD